MHVVAGLGGEMMFHNLSNPLPCGGCKALHRVTNSKKNNNNKKICEQNLSFLILPKRPHDDIIVHVTHFLLKKCGRMQQIALLGPHRPHSSFHLRGQSPS